MIKRTFLSICCVMTAISAMPCTSAIISAQASATGRPLLWKHRDTGSPDGKIEYIAPSNPGEYAYTALFNASDKGCKEAWTGMNSVGFAILNTASYNLKDDNVPDSLMDKEGYVMALALKTCRTVNDFEKLLETLPRPMGVEANFGAIDASGAAAYFETNNHSFTRYDVDGSENGYLIRTNYSHSGRPDQGLGYIREANAVKLLGDAPGGKISAPYLTETVSRSFWHSLMQADLSTPYAHGNEAARWVVDQDFIPRYTSTATIVIEGCEPHGSPADYIMWTGLGYPPCAEIYPVLCTPDGVDPVLRGTMPDGHSPMSDLVKQRRSACFPINRGNGNRYIDMSQLFNASNTGFVQILTKQNLEVYDKINSARKHKTGK